MCEVEMTPILVVLAHQACNDREWVAALKFVSLVLSDHTHETTNQLIQEMGFTDLVVFILNHILEDKHFHIFPVDEMVTILQKVHNVYTNNAEILLLNSNIYFSVELQEKALESAEKAFELDSRNTKTLETFENICCHVLDRWHFVMLNDYTRNSSYQSALYEVMNQRPPYSTVLDLGCGTGILSYLAAKCSDKIYAVEGSSLMCRIAKKTLELHHLDEEILHKVNIINKMSKELRRSVDIPNKIDVLVTEIFDAGLFGEGILSTLEHAWKELLSTESSEQTVIIPNSATIYVEVVESEDLRRESIVDQWSHELKAGNLHVTSLTSFVQSDPYTSIHINDLPSGVKYLTSSKQFLHVDFNNPESIFELNQHLENSILLDVVQEGFVDALVVWFKLHLSDSVHLSTHMDAGGCWEQAVFPVSTARLVEAHSYCDSFHRLKVSPEDKISALYTVTHDRLSMCVTSIARPSVPRLIINKPPDFPSSNQLLPHPLSWCPFNVYCLNDWEIKGLNNKVYQDTVVQSLQQHCASIYAGRSKFVHINDGFSPLCLQALTFGFQQVQVMTPEDSHKALLWKLVQINNLPLERIKTINDLSKLQDPDFLTGLDSDSGSSSQASNQTDDMHVVTMLDLVDHTGRLAQNWIDQLESVREYSSPFRSAHILPGRVDILGMFINSDGLMRRNRVVSNENVLGFPVKDQVNKYSTMNHPDVCFTTLKHTKLTSAFKMFTLNLTEELKHVRLRVNGMSSDFNKEEKNACGNQIVTLEIPTIAEGKLDALVYWFNLHLSPSHCVSTLDPVHHWHQATVILDHSYIQQGQRLHVKFSLQQSTIFVSFME